MAAAIEASGEPISKRELVKRGVDLLSQQIWCWGRDILRPEGNWLLEVGFHRLEAPADRKSCSSVYTLQLPPGRRVVLRGFGVFYGDDRLGGVFLPRFEFSPRYTPHATLACPPWSTAELPGLGPPNASQRDAYASLTLALIDWIGGYEADVADRLGTEYRQATLDEWDKAKRPPMPAEEIVGAWRTLGAAAAEHVETLIPRR